MSNLDIKHFQKHHDYIVCIDSDGTALDVMTIKHQRCFGPCLVKEWNLLPYNETVLKIWNSINLYEKSRGINRFLGLLECLKRVNNKIVKIPELSVLENWTKTTPKLSNGCLQQAIEQTHSEILQKALNWSLAVNNATAQLKGDDKLPFPSVRKQLVEMHGKVDIAVISSAVFDSIYEEWKFHDLLQYLDVMTSQEVGAKSDCIAKLIEKGYEPSHILMLGDAVMDMEAAFGNGACFYPIIPNSEEECWSEFDKYLNVFMRGKFADIQKQLERKFMKSLGERKNG